MVKAAVAPHPAEIVNAKIERTFLGIEDHGLLTAIITVAGESWGQGFGTYVFGAADKRVTSAFGMEFIRQVLETLEVESWEALVGEHVRIERTFEHIHRLGHITKNKWFDVGALAASFKDVA